MRRAAILLALLVIALLAGLRFFCPQRLGSVAHGGRLAARTASRECSASATAEPTAGRGGGRNGASTTSSGRPRPCVRNVSGSPVGRRRASASAVVAAPSVGVMGASASRSPRPAPLLAELRTRD
jgi:hypothetical protein